MFGFVTASLSELSEEQKKRYSAVYCGICRRIRVQHSQLARLGLSYDMAFLALLLMSLYEPEEQQGSRACHLHPIKPRPWLDNDCIRYAADMNVALSYYKCLDDWRDDRKLSAKLMASGLKNRMGELEKRYSRQCAAIADCIRELTALEKARCQNPDETAGCFGRLMAELLVWKEDFWARELRQMGMALGRFVYLADAVADWHRDRKKGKFNPLPGEDPQQWDDYLVMAMGRCTAHFERLPLVQDKEILNNILYSGVWTSLRQKRKQEDKEDGRPL